MDIKIPARGGYLNVSANSGTWTDTRCTVSYIPTDEAWGESVSELPPLTSEEVGLLIRTLKFVMEEA